MSNIPDSASPHHAPEGIPLSKCVFPVPCRTYTTDGTEYYLSVVHGLIRCNGKLATSVWLAEERTLLVSDHISYRYLQMLIGSKGVKRLCETATWKWKDYENKINEEIESSGILICPACEKEYKERSRSQFTRHLRRVHEMNPDQISDCLVAQQIISNDEVYKEEDNRGGREL